MQFTIYLPHSMVDRHEIITSLGLFSCFQKYQKEA